jgi:hypothetical protein
LDNLDADNGLQRQKASRAYSAVLRDSKQKVESAIATDIGHIHASA